MLNVVSDLTAHIDDNSTNNRQRHCPAVSQRRAGWM